MYTPATSTMRYTLPRADLRAQDRRTGAYPTKARTGDRTRTGRNLLWFDDTRTVVYATGTNVNLPTTLQTRSRHLVDDLTSSFTVTGNVDSYAADQWIAHNEQSEGLGAFVEQSLYEQDETNTANSLFMTGAAYHIAPDKFKSKVSNKTIIRIEIPLTSSTTLDRLTGSIYYVNPTAKRFDQVAVEHARNAFGGSRFPTTFAPLPFTPYGHHFMPINDHPFSSLRSDYQLASVFGKLPVYLSDGTDGLFWPGADGTQITMQVTASVLNSRHRANASQSIDLTQYLSQPFLLEKAVVEMPFEAGPGWLNDSFRYRIPSSSLLSVMDMGGPLITFALMRQDSDSTGYRDIIASGTVTSALDMATASYYIITASNAGSTMIAAVPEGLGSFINPSVIITGTSSPSGTNNFFTGSVKMIMEPAVTSHVFRMRSSGSCAFGVFAPSSVGDAGARSTEVLGMAFGPLGKRPGGMLQTSRNVLGNHFASLPFNVSDGTVNPVKVIDAQYENLVHGAGTTLTRCKVYTDVASKTTRSPYLLYPQDKFILAINKHRAVGSTIPGEWTSGGGSTYRAPLALSAYHDVKIPTGTLRITLYGDLVKEDHEFHDTLNQRLETSELWETIGEEPVLDQFDVVYSHELSGSYIDRNNIFAQGPYLRSTADSAGASASPYIATLEYQYDVGHFATNSPSVLNQTWTNLAYTTNAWATGKFAYEVRKSNRSPVFLNNEELFWDTRLPNPPEAMARCNSRYILTTDVLSCLLINAAYSGNVSDLHAGPSIGTSGNGILDWYMTYPYEARYEGIGYTFYDNLKSDAFRRPTPGAHSTTAQIEYIDYNSISLEIGSLSGSADNCVRFRATEGSISLTKWGTGYIPLKKPEFIKYFFGIGNGYSEIDNKHVRPRTANNITADVRGWRYGMMNAFPTYAMSVFRRSRYGQFRDMLEQRLDTKFYDQDGVKEGPVQVRFYDSKGKLTDPLRTLSSNLSSEATSSIPYTDAVTRNRADYDYSILNVLRTAISD